MAAVLRLAGIGDFTRVYWLRFSLIRPERPIRPVASVGLRVWSRLTFAGAAVSGVAGVAGRSLAGRCAMLGRADGSSFPALIRLPVGVDGKPNLMGLPGRPRRKPETALVNRVGLAAKWPPPPLR